MYFTLGWILSDYFIPCFFLIVFSYLYLKYTAINTFNKRSSAPRSNQKILFFTAHPDDECMFFSPTLLALIEEGHRVHVTCFSTGNYYGQGDVRRDELTASCRQLGLGDHQLSTINDSDFPDDPGVRWDSRKLGDKMLAFVEKIHPDIIITFDEGGVSGHSNHRDLYQAVRKLVKCKELRKDIRVYTLDSCSLFRKYISWLDVPISAITSYTVFVSSPQQLMQAWRAMSAHQSQLLWYRKLYMLFSRFMLVNTLQELAVEK